LSDSGNKAPSVRPVSHPVTDAVPRVDEVATLLVALAVACFVMTVVSSRVVKSVKGTTEGAISSLIQTEKMMKSD
jgi:hypothetical protein